VREKTKPNFRHFLMHEKLSFAKTGSGQKPQGNSTTAAAAVFANNSDVDDMHGVPLTATPAAEGTEIDDPRTLERLSSGSTTHARHSHAHSGLGAGHTTVVPDLPFCYVNRSDYYIA